MFTGIVQSVGSVVRLESRGGDRRLHIDAPALEMADVQVGDSIAVSGVCLTVVELPERGFAADVSNESLSLTTLANLQVGADVNLEKALRLSDRLGGHLVAGHVDGVGNIVSVAPVGRSQHWTVQAPANLARYIATKGSVSVDGVSLTVNAVEGARFHINLIPHTIEHTSFRARRTGDRVNLEVDLMARYAERLLNARADSDIDINFLSRQGLA
jgi:riboflavin synthase